MANKLTTRIILRNDSTAGWSAVEDTVVLLKGEVGLEFVTTTKLVDGEYQNIPTGKVKMKIGDGVSTWAELSYFGGDECHVTEVTVAKGANHKAAIAEAVADTTVNKGDIAIVKEAVIAADNEKLVAGTIEQKYQYTSYVYGETASGDDWKAMDGNYSADNVYFDEDFTFTTKVGTVQTLTNGSAKVDAAGKSVKQFFSGLFAKETAGGADTSATNKGQPYASVTLKNNGTNITSDTSYEVGTQVVPSYVARFEDGKYTYGPEPTGITVTGWTVTSTNGGSYTTSSGNDITFTVGESTSYSITATAAHTAGAYAKSNIGNVGTYQFTAGNKSATSKKITGYRAQFYGAQITPIDLTSDKIRGLNSCKPGNTTTPPNGALAGKSQNGFSITIPDKCTQVVIALYGKSLKNVFDSGAYGTDIVGSFVEVSANSAIAIAGANNYSSANYKVYVYAPDAALGANTYYAVIG